MKKKIMIACLEISVLCCLPIHKCNSNDNNMRVEQIIELQVHNFSEVPVKLLSHIEKMGIDSSLILNEYEGNYLNFIFQIDIKDFNFVGKKIGFSKSKIDYFRDTRERFDRNSTIVGGSGLYIFNENQKKESGGYDAYIVYWSKRVVPIEDVVKQLKVK